jgi:hypothetical protein
MLSWQSHPQEEARALLARQGAAYADAERSLAASQVNRWRGLGVNRRTEGKLPTTARPHAVLRQAQSLSGQAWPLHRDQSSASARLPCSVRAVRAADARASQRAQLPYVPPAVGVSLPLGGGLAPDGGVPQSKTHIK